VAAPERPVVFIPGMIGSRLCERATGNVVWGERTSLRNFKELELPIRFDIATLPHVACGPLRSVQVLGPWRYHQYDDLFTTLLGIGFSENVNLHVFSYDWRLSNRHNAAEFARFVSQKIPSGQFDIVAHSMGGIIAKLWLAQHGGDERVKWFITLGTPFWGSASALKTLDEGWGFWANLAARGLETVRATTLTFPSVYELLPNYERCCAFQVPGSTQPDFFDPFDPEVWRLFNWVPASFKNPDRLTWLSAVLADAKAIAQVKLPVGVQVVPIASSLIDTSWRAIFNKSDGKVVRYIAQPGDGTVYQLSAANGVIADARPSLTEHQRIFADDAARQIIRWVLVGGQEPVAGFLTNIKARLRTASGLEVPLSSVRVEIIPGIIEPNQDGNLFVELTGDSHLADSDLSNLTASLGAPSSPLQSAEREVVRVAAGEAFVRLSFKFRAPAEGGPFSATVKLPNVADISDVGLVVAP